MVGSGGPDNKSYFSILQSNETVFIIFITVAFSFIPVIIYPIRTVFSSKCPKIVIKDTNSTHNPPTPSSKTCELVDQEKARLNEGKMLLKICIEAVFQSD